MASFKRAEELPFPKSTRVFDPCYEFEALQYVDFSAVSSEPSTMDR